MESVLPQTKLSFTNMWTNKTFYLFVMTVKIVFVFPFELFLDSWKNLKTQSTAVVTFTIFNSNIRIRLCLTSNQKAFSRACGWHFGPHTSVSATDAAKNTTFLVFTTFYLLTRLAFYSDYIFVWHSIFVTLCPCIILLRNIYWCMLKYKFCLCFVLVFNFCFRTD